MQMRGRTCEIRSDMSEGSDTVVLHWRPIIAKTDEVIPTSADRETHEERMRLKGLPRTGEKGKGLCPLPPPSSIVAWEQL